LLEVLLGDLRELLLSQGRSNMQAIVPLIVEHGSWLAMDGGVGTESLGGIFGEGRGLRLVLLQE
jgi:hypothetical protein